MKCELCGSEPMTVYCNNGDCDRRYVGITRAKVTHQYDQGLTIPLTVAITEDGDYTPADMDWDKE